jgi:hypothetical protein
VDKSIGELLMIDMSNPLRLAFAKNVTNVQRVVYIIGEAKKYDTKGGERLRIRMPIGTKQVF